jgi:hypothetical protein
LFSRFPGRQNAGTEIAEEAWAFFKDKRRTPPSEAGLERNTFAETL